MTNWRRPGLTPAQKQMLSDVRRAGVKVYNGRARRAVIALESAGLVTATWTQAPQVKGNGIQWVEVITVKPKPG